MVFNLFSLAFSSSIRVCCLNLVGRRPSEPNPVSIWKQALSSFFEIQKQALSGHQNFTSQLRPAFSNGGVPAQ